MIGQTISHYKILEKLGEGGMGIVYKAQDTKLNRLVALKFLPAHLSASEQDKARFLQEAQAAASLNHPNICTIYGIDEHEGQIFIAMELIDGETLREKKQNFSLKQTIEIGAQVAEGLAAAHEKGIVHRDIKPENIMIRKDGIVQIMDFGLAKLRGASRLTKQGTMVGTVGYMSPEQVQGQDTDHRTDIFSLGVILYEMLSGQSPFKGVHETAVIYEIVNVDAAPISSHKPDVDPELDAIVLECLAKDPDERFQSAKEVAKELRRAKRQSSRQNVSRISAVREMAARSQERTASGIVPIRFMDRIRGPKSLWIGLTLLFLVTTIAAVIFRGGRGSSASSEVIRADILMPEKYGLSNSIGGAHLAVSPDGRKVAFVATDSTGQDALWVRPLGALSGSMLSGTEGASYPFWSPDSRYIGFFAHGKLKKIEAGGGPPVSLCDVLAPRGASWSPNGTIVLPLDQSVGVSMVPEAGGVPALMTHLDTVRGEQTHRWPVFLPDGTHFLYLSRVSTAGGSELDAINVGSIDGKPSKRLLGSLSNAAYASGYLLYMRENSLMAHPFDPDALELKGDPFPIAEAVQFNPRFSVAAFSVSHTGVLVYESNNASFTPEVLLMDPRGKTIASLGHHEIMVSARLSNDARRIAMDLFEVRERNSDIWMYEISRGVNTRFTFDPSLEIQPVWSADGSRIVFSSNRNGHHDLFEKVSTGAVNEALLLQSPYDKIATDWSPDGKALLFFSREPKTKTDLWLLPMTGDRKPVPLLQTEYSEMNGRFSPDMKWIAYQSDESGKNQIYVMPYPGPGAKRQVSVNGGTNPRWNRDGKEIYFMADTKVMAAEVNGNGATFEIGKVRMHFDPTAVGATVVRDISRDGQILMVDKPPIRQSSVPLTLVVNWDVDLKRKRESSTP